MAINTKRDGNILIVDLNRVDKGNALNKQLQKDLAQTWQDFEDDDELVVAILTGGDHVFSIGHDREELLQGVDDINLPLPEEGMFPIFISKPVIAAVEGPCYGLGFELALSCDLRIAGDTSLWGFPDQNLFVQYRFASVLLQRITFSGDALQLLLAGGTRDVNQMRHARIVNETAAHGQALNTAINTAKDLAKKFGSAANFKKGQLIQFSGIPIPEAQRQARTVALP